MSRRGHVEVDHTADLGFEVWAEDAGGLLEEATVALAELCYDVTAVEARDTVDLDVEADSPEALLVKWLNAVYLTIETGPWLCVAASIDCDDGRARGRLQGELHDPSRHRLYTEIKAVTYHQLRIVRGPDGLLRTLVILDV